ncbi:TIGR02452 family protein [Lactobacillus sp. PSON]|uniref:TIGR02452 family protein n=1 Tax=Lactobacillus sp. PSON TaxID=3455454 RepID=UPI004042B86F
MEQKWKKEINESIANSTVYQESDKDKFNNPDTVDTEIIYQSIGTPQAMVETRKQFPNKKIAALSFADFKNPGGGYLVGARAQEEMLCHRSDLFQIISSFHDFYTFNRAHLNKELYLDRAIYIPNVIVKDVAKVDIISCAAPNFRRANVSYKTACEVLKTRMQFVKQLAEDQHVDVLILGAWGAGAFGFRPQEVAELWRETFEEPTSISKVIFAVISKHDNNAEEIFEEVLKMEN